MLQRAVLASGVLLALHASCSAPDGDLLYQPFAPRASSGGAGPGGGSSLPLPPPPVGGSDASTVEGQGGALGFADAGGTGEAGGGEAGSASDAGTSDAGDAASSDAAPPAAACSTQIELCDGIDNDCDGSIDEGNTCAASCVGFVLDEHGYMFCADSVTRDAAAARCQLQRMHLAWVETPQENASLVTRIRAAGVPASQELELLTYLGGSDSGDEGAWSWRGQGAIPDGFRFWQGLGAEAGGQAVAGSYVNWAATEPNNTAANENCAVLSVLGNTTRQPGDWDDRDCASPLPFLCEAP